ncbi:MAG: ABC transporter ATP-binding protein/permease [Spirochaetaceae bacterium]|jgi:ATP-binding cassette subfamily B protein|nr:ABC transporter ATP-binding protein/permease [Spirochaetaceae bacterium]
MNHRKTGMARLLELAFLKKGLTLGACIFSVLSVAGSFTPYLAIYCIIRELADPEALNTGRMIRWGVLAGVGAGGAILLNWFALLCSHIGAFATLYRLKLDFAEHIARLPLGFHTGNATGKLRKIVDENIEKLEGFIAHQLPDLVGSFTMPIITLAILFAFEWRLGLASFVPIIAGYLLQALAFSGESSQRFIKKYQASLEDMNTAGVEYIRGISVVKAFNQTIFSFRKFHEIIADYGRFVTNYTLSFQRPWQIFMLLIHHVYLFLLPAIILLAGGAADYGKFALASLFYLIFSFYLATPFTKIMYVSQVGRQIADGIDRMDAMLAVPPLPEPLEPKRTAEYSVSFENVSFSYSDDTPALQNISFTAKQGEITALVGPSGGGKSTIAHLMPRFYDVNEGAIKIGGVDIRAMSNEYLMSLVSFVFQEVFLFKQSVFENIKIGDKNASREQVIAAARAAQCQGFIEKLPQSYDTVIGGKNIHLSGGEKQRIVIARAILKNAPILVLDEATAFADPENEYNIQKALEQLMKNKTVIIIAHRLSTVRGADSILVIDKGSLAETGNFGVLVAGNGRFSRMWRQYSSAMDWAVTRSPQEASHV